MLVEEASERFRKPLFLNLCCLSLFLFFLDGVGRIASNLGKVQDPSKSTLEHQCSSLQVWVVSKSLHHVSGTEDTRDHGAGIAAWPWAETAVAFWN